MQMGFDIGMNHDLILPKNGSLTSDHPKNFNTFGNHNILTLNITVIFHLASYTFINWKYKLKILIFNLKQYIGKIWRCAVLTINLNLFWLRGSWPWYSVYLHPLETFENTQCTCESTFENAQWRKVHDHDTVSISTHWKPCNCQASFSHKRTDFDCPNDFGYLSEIYYYLFHLVWNMLLMIRL